MRRSLTVAVMAAATLLAGGTATASESPSPSPSAEIADSPDQATPLERVSAYTQPSVVFVSTEFSAYVYDTYNKLYLNNGNPFTLSYRCTGYVVTPDGYIATAGHCVDVNDVKTDFLITAADWALNNGYYQSTTLTMEDVLGFGDYKIENADGKGKADLKVKVGWPESAGGVETSKALPARVVKWQSFDKGDGAVLKVEADNLNALPLTEAPVEIGNEVVAVGYPGSVDSAVDASWTPSFKEGTISSEKTIGGGLLTVYEISAATSGGMSGGPVVNLDGEVVGFVSFDPGDSETEPYRAGLDAYFAGDKETAVENLSTVVDNQPTNDFAKQYLDKAEALPDPPAEESGGGEDGGSNLGLIIGIAVGVLVLLAILAVVLLTMSRKKKGGSAAAAPSHAYGGPQQASGPGYPQQGGPAPAATGTAVLTPTAIQAPPPAPAQVEAPAPAAPIAPPAPEQQVDADVFCQNCGTKGEPHQKFCKHCGTAL